MAGVEVIRWCGEEARAGPWRGRRDVAYLSPRTEGRSPSSGLVRCCLEKLAAEGFSRVVTSALAPVDQVAFLGAGFRVQEHLRVLAHDLRRLPARPVIGGVGLRKARQQDTSAVLVVDRLAFAHFWQLDEVGLVEAVNATPHARFALAAAPGLPVAGYSVVGRTGRRGFVQRLAVHPARQGTGIGKALVVDGLYWLRRWQVSVAYVNTQADNERAYALYRSLGFEADTAALSVLSTGLEP